MLLGRWSFAGSLPCDAVPLARSVHADEVLHRLRLRGLVRPEQGPRNDCFFFGVFFVWVLLSQGFGGGLSFFFGHKGLSVTTSIVPRTNFLVPAFTRLIVSEAADEDLFELLPDKEASFGVAQPSAQAGPAVNAAARHRGTSPQRTSFMATVSDRINLHLPSIGPGRPAMPAARSGAGVSQKHTTA